MRQPTAEALRDWLYSCGTNPELAEVLTEFLYAKGEARCHGSTLSRRHQYEKFLHSQERIGWVKMMEGMISEELLQLDRQDILDNDCKLMVDAWVQKLIEKLLEATHGVWIYRNIMMHDSTAGFIATKGKEQLLQEIEAQIELGNEGLAEQDRWMIEVNLDVMDTSSGEKESYWLLPINTARERHSLSQLT